MKAKLPLIARILLGLLFTGAGIAGLMSLNQPPPEGTPEKLITFFTGMAASGYFIPFLKSVEVICGVLLLTGFFVPLALVVLAPIVLNIFLVHAFMAPEGLPLAVVAGVILAYLAFFSEPYSGPIKLLFRKK